jgi:hypothetical protein
MAKSHLARSSDSNFQSWQQGGRGARGRGLRDSRRGAWARQRLIASWLWSAEHVRGALECLFCMPVKEFYSTR